MLIIINKNDEYRIIFIKSEYLNLDFLNQI